MSTGQWALDDWHTLVRRIDVGQVTPMLGAGASASIVGTAAELASSWASAVDYPFDDHWSLPAVAQYVATTQDQAQPGDYINGELATHLRNFVVADIDDVHHPYRTLPRRPFPIWLTTNYDDLIARALNAANKPPRVGVALWTPPDLYWDTTRYNLNGFTPDADHPLVFHVHGHYNDSASMVITETHYLEFLEQMGRPSQVLPEVVEQAIASTSLLFIGYSFRDINLQLLLRRWKIPRRAYAVRPFPPGVTDAQRAALVEFTPKYLKAVTGADFKMYWGTASEFCAELEHAITGGNS